MPTYQYACTECGERLEAVQSFSDPALTECPNCHGRLRKVFNSVGIVFKGSGFYRNDSRAGNGNGNGNGSSTDTKTESTKPESTPATSAASSSSGGGSAQPASSGSTASSSSSSSSGAKAAATSS